MLFHFGQRQQLVDGLGQPLLLVDDAAREMHAVGLGQRLLQQLGAPRIAASGLFIFMRQ